MNDWFIPIECGILAVVGTWAVKRDFKLIKDRWKSALKRFK